MIERGVEIWKEIPGFPGNEASTTGYVRTYWDKVRNKQGRGFHRELFDTPRMLWGTPDDNGYLHTNVYCEPDDVRYTRKIHVLIACTWLSLPDDFDQIDYTVDHIHSGPEGKLDNSIWNLQWLPRADNIRKAYQDGMCDDRIRAQYKDVVVQDTWLNRELYFESIIEACRWLGLKHSTISHAKNKDVLVGKRYYFNDPGMEDRLMYANDEYECYQRFSWV